MAGQFDFSTLLPEAAINILERLQLYRQIHETERQTHHINREAAEEERAWVALVLDLARTLYYPGRNR